MKNPTKLILALALCLSLPLGTLFAFHYDRVDASYGSGDYSQGSVSAPAGAEVYYYLSAYSPGWGSSNASIIASADGNIYDSVYGSGSASDSRFLSSAQSVSYQISATADVSGLASAEIVVAW